MQMYKDSEKEFFKQEGVQGQDFKKCICLKIREKEIREKNRKIIIVSRKKK